MNFIFIYLFFDSLTDNLSQYMIYVSLFQVRQKKNMCVSDHPTDSPFSRRPTQVFLLCDSNFFLLGII